ncbi:MAG: hypothetical protein AAF940_12170 [Pseudomonadota bacterium]
MFVLILQTALLLAIAFILGCIVGCVARTIFADTGQTTPAAASPAPAPLAPTPAPAAPQKAEAEAEPVALATKAPAKPKASRAKGAAAPQKTAASKKTEAKKPQATPAKATKAPPKKKTAASGPPKAGTKVDDLKLIKGIGTQNEARLQAFGITLYQQIADWTKADANEWGERLAFPGRIEREDWIGQAKILAKGGSTAFSKRAASGAVSTSQGAATVGDLGKKPRLLTQARKAGPDKLTQISGVGPSFEKRLNAIGIFHFDQIAKLSAAEARWVGIAIGDTGKIESENWVEKAKKLAASG